MLNWIKDALGINKYALVWDFESYGVRLSGRNDFRKSLSKRSAQKIADDLCRMYGAPGKSHWIEQAAARKAETPKGENDDA